MCRLVLEIARVLYLQVMTRHMPKKMLENWISCNKWLFSTLKSHWNFKFKCKYKICLKTSSLKITRDFWLKSQNIKISQRNFNSISAEKITTTWIIFSLLTNLIEQRWRQMNENACFYSFLKITPSFSISLVEKTWKKFKLL